VLRIDAEITGRSGLNTYATALRAADLITVHDVKDITVWAGLRNDAAHGDFDGISRERAGLMADGINLFMQRHQS
jgi:hypothetical protein